VTKTSRVEHAGVRVSYWGTLPLPFLFTTICSNLAALTARPYRFGLLLPQLTSADRNKATMTRTIRGLLDRLAQRMPVRFKLDDVPSDPLLVAGRTATVSIGKIRWW
jgi:hypothetical protein